MPKEANQKLRLYCLARILIEKTDDQHGLSIPEMEQELERCGFCAGRKTLYDDLNALGQTELEIIHQKEGRKHVYHVGSKLFELAELKLLVDAIQASKFITEKKSKELIRKLTGFASRYEAMRLQRQVVVAGRIKSMNESIYYNVDALHGAISNDCRIRFEYLKWNADKQLVPKREREYEASPWALTYDNENYYLIAYSEEHNAIRHYRVDKMRGIEVTEERRTGWEHFRKQSVASYSERNFGMFGGETAGVRLRFQNDGIGALLDRFGKEIPIFPADEGYSECVVRVVANDLFFGWVSGNRPRIQIVGPEEVVERMKGWAREVWGMYA